MRQKLRLRVAGWLVKCAKRVAPECRIYLPGIMPPPMEIRCIEKKVDLLQAAVEYRMPQDMSADDFERRVVLPRITAELANALMCGKFVELISTKEGDRIRWTGKVQVVR